MTLNVYDIISKEMLSLSRSLLSKYRNQGKRKKTNLKNLML
jgi:hypothetical protein